MLALLRNSEWGSQNQTFRDFQGNKQMKQTLTKGIVILAAVAAWNVGCSSGPHGFVSRAASSAASGAAAMQIDGNTYIVQAGDTIESVAYRYRISTSELARLNPHLRNSVYAGQPLKVRASRGDGRRFNNTETVARAHSAPTHTEVPASYRPSHGQQINSQQPVVVSAVPVREVPIRENPAVVSENQLSRQVREEIIQERIISESGSEHAPIQLESTISHSGWIWPIRGEVVREYAPGEVNGQGVDIAGLPGQQVRAVAGGTVIYAGRDLSNAGNLVIIRHSEEVLSTYSHAKNMFVAENEIVNGGDPIASLGASSSGESVLHFGVRKGGKPVDPLGYLPNR